MATGSTSSRISATSAFSFIVCRLLLFMILLQVGCTTTAPKSLHLEATEDKNIVWPAEPEMARYRYLGQLTGEKNFQSETTESSSIAKFFRWLVGLDGKSRDPNILQRPQVGMTDSRGRIFVTDMSRGAVLVFDKQAGELKVWEWAEKGVRFKTPVGIVQDKRGEILVADADLGAVFRLDQNGQPLGKFATEVLERPTGMAHDPLTQHTYVADTGAHDIKVFDMQGQLVRKLGRRGDAKGEFNAPTYLAFSQGRLYVTDTFNSRIQVLDPLGKHIMSLGKRGLYVGNLTRPKGVTVDSEGNIYIVESYYDHLLIFDKQGRFLLPIGGTGNKIGQFFLPAGVWSDKKNRIYVADMFNGRIVVLQYLGAQQ